MEHLKRVVLLNKDEDLQVYANKLALNYKKGYLFLTDFIKQETNIASTGDLIAVKRIRLDWFSEDTSMDKIAHHGKILIRLKGIESVKYYKIEEFNSKQIFKIMKNKSKYYAHDLSHELYLLGGGKD